MPTKVGRKISKEPEFTCFKPDSIDKKILKKLWLINELKVDEFESFKLSHLEWLSMKEWSKKMWISASTFNRILNSAQKKIADSLVNWKAIRVFRSDWTHNCDY